MRRYKNTSLVYDVNMAQSRLLDGADGPKEPSDLKVKIKSELKVYLL